MPGYTPQQQAAIEAAGDVVVLAGAGAGKTRVLVDRLIARLLRAESPLSLDRVLVVTFTEAAAAEMRKRLAAGLEQARTERPEDPRPAEQLALLPVAAIGTIHSFCLRLVREHFHALRLDPQLGVLEPAAARRLEAEVFDGLLRARLAADPAGGPGGLLRGWFEGDAARLEALVLQIHRLARTLPDPAGWLTARRADCAAETPTAWLAALPEVFRAWAEAWRPELAQGDGQTPLPRAAAHLGRPLATAAEIGACLGNLLGDDRAVGAWPRGTKKLRKPFDKFYKEAAELAGLLAPETLAETWAAARPALAALYALVEEFETALADAKREAAAVDFSDLEQLALRLLRGGAAAALAARYDLVAVDEYQDVNDAQDAIIEYLTRPGGERFLVGDLKQCIYRFRLANPRVLAGRAARTPPLLLNANFRSHEAILDFVNHTFARLFHPALGGVAWDAGAALAFGAPEARGALRGEPAGRVELHLLEPVGDEDAEGAAEGMQAAVGAEREARLVARRLQRLRAAGLVVQDTKRGGPRPAAWRDMVVLLRSVKGRADAWAQEFAHAGIPLEAPRGGFLEAAEILDLRCLLEVLDNPRQDLPLVAVLRSPLAGFTLDELAVVRLAARGESWWLALQAVVRTADPAEAEEPVRAAVASARDKAAAALAALRRWRRLAREGALAPALETVLAETGYEAWLAVQPHGRARLANVRRLLALTRRFDQHQRHGLYRFLRHLEAIEAAEAGPEQALPPDHDAVRLMSIHAAKGLEFPVVVVAGLGTLFNEQDERGDFLLDAGLGLAPRFPHGPQQLLLDTPARWIAKQRSRRDRLGEELRLLYVAMTRAADRLLLTAAPGKKFSWPEAAGPGPLPLRVLENGRSPLHWLAPLLADLTGDADWRETGGGDGGLLAWCVHAQPPVPAPAAAPLASLPPVLSNAEAEAAKSRFAWRYPHEAATRKPAKTNVTALRRRWQEEANEDEAAPAHFARGHPRGDEAAAEAGVAHHLFLEHLDLAVAPSAAKLAAAADRMAAEGWLTPEQRGALDLGGLKAFLESELGQRVRARAADVEREVPFTFRLDAAEAARLQGMDAAGSTGEFQVVQGVADLVVRMPDAIWLVDFKTDDVRPDDAAARAEEHRAQLELYALALERIYGRPVTERWVWFLRARRGVRLLSR